MGRGRVVNVWGLNQWGQAAAIAVPTGALIETGRRGVRQYTRRIAREELAGIVTRELAPLQNEMRTANARVHKRIDEHMIHEEHSLGTMADAMTKLAEGQTKLGTDVAYLRGQIDGRRGL